MALNAYRMTAAGIVRELRRREYDDVLDDAVLGCLTADTAAEVMDGFGLDYGRAADRRTFRLAINEALEEV